MTKAEFREFERDQRLRERRGRVWTLHVMPHERGDGMLRAGDDLRHVAECFADDYAPVAETSTATR